jgi:hypothetical protein
MGMIPWNKGIPRTEKEKENISKSTLGRIVSQQGRDNIARAMKGRIFSEETREKISKAHKGLVEREGTGEKISALKMGKKTKRSSSKFIGVYKRKRGGWYCSIVYKRKRYYIGTFKTEVEAAMAYNETALDLYGWKAILNIIAEEEIRKIWEED